MIEGWRQILRDIRAALKLPVNGSNTHPGQNGDQRNPEQLAGGEPPVHGSDAQILEMTRTKKNIEDDSPQVSDLSEQQTNKMAESKIRAKGFSVSYTVKWWIVVMIVVLIGTSLLFGEKLFGKSAPAPGVVATFVGGQVTVGDIRKHIEELALNEPQLNEQLQTIEGYRAMVEEMVSDELVRQWSKTRDVKQEQDFRHVMEHIEEDINLGDIDAALHEKGMGVSEEDLQSYYDANREDFGELTLTQAKDDIRLFLQSQREGEFVKLYIDNLRTNASITSNLELLEVPEPSESDYLRFFSVNEEKFQVPARIQVDEIRIPVGADIEAARNKASQILIRLRSGETLGAIGTTSGTSVKSGLIVNNGQNPPGYDEVLDNLDYKEFSEVFLAGESFYILRLISREPQRTLTLSEAKPAIRTIILPEIQDRWFDSKSDQTLLTVNGQRLTVGEFWQEFKELPTSFALEYQGIPGWKLLAERLIDRLLLLDDSSRQLTDSDDSIAIEEAQLDVLAQMMEQEEVDDLIEVTEQETKTYYEEIKEKLVRPPQSQIRFIMVDLGQSEEDSRRAWDRAKEAYELLVPGLFRDGSDFADVAREYSDDETTAEQGGLLEGWIGEGPDLFMETEVHSFHQSVMAIDVGEISRPFEWNGAIYIIQVTDRTEAEQLTFEEAKHFLDEDLRSQKHKELRDRLSSKLMERYDVEFYEKELKAAFDE